MYVIWMIQSLPNHNGILHIKDGLPDFQAIHMTYDFPFTVFNIVWHIQYRLYEAFR